MEEIMFRWMRKYVILSSLVFVGGILSSENVDAKNASANQKTTYYQRTAQYHNEGGAIEKSLYAQNELESLTRITHGTQYHGNTSLDKTATEHVYVLGSTPLPNFMGADGVLQLFNESKLMTDEMVKDAATYWNKIAGAKIVEVVSSQSESDEVIWDNQEPSNTLGAQFYDGNGIMFYVNAWHVDSVLRPEQAKDWKVATLIHEIGHALGVPHLGGGEVGYNAQNAKLHGTEFMASWSVGTTSSPLENLNGVKSTSIDAAALALAALSWEKPQKLASWVLSNPEAYVNYHNGEINSTILNKFGIEIDFEENYIQKKEDVVATVSILKNYNVYTINDKILDDGIGAEKAKLVGTTASMGLIGKNIEAVAYYTSTKGNIYYKVTVEGQEYVINTGAFDTAKFGIEIDFKDNFIQIKKEVSKKLYLGKNYNVYQVNDQLLNAGWGTVLAKNINTTDGLDLIGKEIDVIAEYTSTKGNPYYRVLVEGYEYVINSAAFVR